MKNLTDIIEGCKRNDRWSQEQLYREYYPAMYALCRKYFVDQDQIVTALNNGMLKVYKHIDQFDSTKGEFFNWLYTVVKHAALTQLRDQKIYPAEELDNKHTDSIFEESEDDVFTVTDYIEKLPPSTRVVCNLFYTENFSIKEIAQSQGMKEGTVKWHLNEGRSKIKSLVTQRIDSSERL